MKKLLSVFLALVLVITVIPIGIFSVSAETNGDFTYSVTDGNATITEYIGNEYSVTIPSALDSYPVTCIGKHAFSQCAKLTSVIIPDSVTIIDNNAFFDCKSLASVAIPDSVTSINGLAFSNCASLKSITIPSGVTSIGAFAFSLCNNLSRAIFAGNAPDKMGVYVFPSYASSFKIYYRKGATGWTNPWNGYTTEEIDPSTLHTVTYNANGATEGNTPCDSNTYVYNAEVTVMDNIGSLKKTTYEFVGWNTKEDGTGEDYAVNNTFKMEVEDIVLYAKWYRDETQGESQQWVNDGITWDYLPLGTSLCMVYGCSPAAGALVIPESINGKLVISIYERAFADCSELTSVSIPNSVTTIGNETFYGCSKLTDVTIPSGVTNIRYDVFSDCTKLTKINVDENSKDYSSRDGVLFNKNMEKLIKYPGGIKGSYTIPDSVISIEYDAFNGCSELTDVTIPSSVAGIEYYAFQNCAKLTSIDVDVKNTTFSSSDGVLFNKKKSELIVCPDGKTGNYVIPGSVTCICSYAFSGCSGLTDVTIPNSVININYYTFSGCSGLASVIIPSSVMSIYDYAFSDCTNLTQIIVDDNNTYYSSRDGVLFNKDEMTLIQYPGGKTGSYIIPGGVKVIGNYAFEGCSKLTDVTIPNSVINIEYFAFSGCSGLTEIIIPNSVKNLDGISFNGCSGLTNVSIPRGVEYIGSFMFKGCTGLTGVTIPSSVKYFNDDVFIDCGNLAIIRGAEGSYAEKYAKRKGIAFEIIKSVLGDVNYDEKITAVDALMILQASVNKIVLEDDTAILADVDGNDAVSASDALLILQYAVERINEFPAVW